MTNVLKKFSICEIPPRDNLRSQTNDDHLICVAIKSNLCYSYSNHKSVRFQSIGTEKLSSQQHGISDITKKGTEKYVFGRNNENHVS